MLSKDEIIRMFHEAGELAKWKPGVGNPLVINYLTHFAALVAAHEREKEIKRVAEGHGWTQAHWTAYEESIAAAEREACAKEADYYAKNSTTARNIAAAIRARGEK